MIAIRVVTWVVFVCNAASVVGEDDSRPTPERRAIAFLSREAPKWPTEHKCFSCHNNGDAARALFLARRMELPFDGAALDSTLGFLTRPAAWKDNGPEGEFSDKRLAAIQFAFALSSAVDAGLVTERSPFVRAAELVAAEQDEDGSWGVDADSLAGSPVTYGRALATAVSRRVLAAADAKMFTHAIDRAGGWLLKQRPKGVLDSAAVIMGLEHSAAEAAAEVRTHCLEIIRTGQATAGGWGPFATSPPEVFDTAVVLLALSAMDDEVEIKEMIGRGQDFLRSRQLDDGSWPGTTRPPGGDSYAQAISTTAWATLALLTTGKAE